MSRSSRQPAAPARRETPSARRYDARFPVVGWMVLASFGANAQTADAPAAGTGRSLSIVPNLSINETLTDNANLVATNARSESITQVSAGLHASSSAGRIRGSIDYALSAFLYANGTQKNGFQNTLSGAATAEAVEKLAFVDVAGSISRQAISALGKQSNDPGLNDTNSTQVSTFSVSPYVRGRFMESGDYLVRVAQSVTRTDAQANFNSQTTTVQAHVGGGTALSALSWSADASSQMVDYDATTSSRIDQIKLSLNYLITPDLRLALVGGRERDNLATSDRETRNTGGATLTWQPSERTRVVVGAERSFFGNSHNLILDHRTARTVWSFSDTQSLSAGSSGGASGSVVNAYDLYFAQFASIEPDPVLRQQRVNTFLQLNGISPTAQIISGFLNTAPLVQRTRLLSFGLLGVRDTLTFSASRTSSRRADGGSLVANGAVGDDNLRQTSLYLNLAHRLTPDASANVALSQQKSRNGDGSTSSTLTSASVLWTGRLSARIFGSLGARRSRFTSTTEPYTENAVFATLSLKF